MTWYVLYVEKISNYCSNQTLSRSHTDFTWPNRSFAPSMWNSQSTSSVVLQPRSGCRMKNHHLIQDGATWKAAWSTYSVACLPKTPAMQLSNPHKSSRISIQRSWLLYRRRWIAFLVSTRQMVRSPFRFSTFSDLLLTVTFRSKHEQSIRSREGDQHDR